MLAVVWAPTHTTYWRAEGPYLPTLASKTALVEETRLFLLTYERLSNMEMALQALLNEVLAQRSRRTRTTIVAIIRSRLLRWNAPTWVLQNLMAFAQESHLDALRAALLLHIARQDHLLYDFVQQVIVPRRQRGEFRIFISDVQTFFDTAQKEHPEVGHWSFETRLRLSRGMLATLRDCGLLKGAVQKHITFPFIPEQVVTHLIRLLQAEGVTQEQMATHPDWNLWLWSPAQAKAAIERFFHEEQGV
ncbi:DUF1819 family protein [Ktedonosporobacter rubrisoli]|uniref:DUF1819 family protein n=1 Tax=Ktedonosporobacter rubrisoli TaxID=2509675 RepID=A0A4P6K3S1_KTERU|nr:DUF1819 family protein [Ktedonosporobacter rubrisoli]